MSTNIFAIQKTFGPLGRAAAGAGLALAACATLALGAGVAGADPQQPVLVDDPLPAPVPAGMDPSMAVNIANGLLGQLSTLLDSFFPGAGELLNPGTAAAGGLVPGAAPGLGALDQTPMLPGSPAMLPGSPAMLPGSPAMLPGSPGALTPGLTPGLPGQVPGLAAPGQIPGVPGQTPGLSTGMPGYPGATSPGLPGNPAMPSPGIAGLLSPVDTNPVV